MFGPDIYDLGAFLDFPGVMKEKRIKKRPQGRVDGDKIPEFRGGRKGVNLSRA